MTTDYTEQADFLIIKKSPLDKNQASFTSKTVSNPQGAVNICPKKIEQISFSKNLTK